MDVNEFGVADYILFSLLLFLSTLIGLYYGCTGSRQRSVNEYLLGDRQMSVLPIALSVFASYMSAVGLISVPVEIYSYGSQFCWTCVAFALAVVITSYFYLPVFYDLKITSVNEYLEKRFNKTISTFGAFFFILQVELYMSNILYATSLILTQVTGIDVWIGVGITLGICTLYTVIGGMKAVMWTDVLQSIFMMFAMVALVIKGIITVGGHSELIRINSAGQRFEFLNFDANPHVLYTVWTQAIGGTFTWSGVFAVGQTQVQRYLSAKSLKVARWALFWSMVIMILIHVVLAYLGFAMYAFYYNCDPFLAGKVKTTQQMVPLFAIDMVRDIPGFIGLFVAGLLSGSFSSLSSGLNALAAVTLKDFVLQFSRLKNVNDQTAGLLAKGIAFTYGLLCLFCILLVQKFETLVQASISLFGAIGGPLLGTFTLGMFFPWANSWGAGTGLLTGLTISIWIGLGSLFHGNRSFKKPLSMSSCLTNGTNFTYTDNEITKLTNFTTISMAGRQLKSSYFSFLYDISFNWFSFLSFIIVLIVGLAVSFLKGANKPEDVDRRLLSPVVRKYCHRCRRSSLNEVQMPMKNLQN